jgi:hypothetical protein
LVLHFLEYSDAIEFGKAVIQNISPRYDAPDYSYVDRPTDLGSILLRKERMRDKKKLKTNAVKFFLTSKLETTLVTAITIVYFW